MIKITITFILLITMFLVNLAEARVLPRFRNVAGSGKKIISSSVGVTPRLRADRKALLVYFSNLNKVRSVTYTLIYQTDGKDEGVSGSIDSSSGNSTSRELLFGTCSSGVCRYHPNISNMKLEVTLQLMTGKKSLRRFRIKV